MRDLVLAAGIALASLAACSKADQASEAREISVPTITVPELATKLGRGECQAVDANGDETRKKMGVIPGAVLLTDYDSFGPGELPADKSKPLVFYCANTYCGASHRAAARAITAGYTHVQILPAGIAGWVTAGQQTASI